jgi:hypothetical protein
VFFPGTLISSVNITDLHDIYIFQRNWQHEGTIKNEQSRETGNIGYTRHKRKANKTKKHNTIYIGDLHTQDIKRRKTKQKHNTICVGDLHTQGIKRRQTKQKHNTICVVASFSGLFILDCSFMLPVSLDCSFLIVPSCCQFLWIVHS